jgi:hypothetical protein
MMQRMALRLLLQMSLALMSPRIRLPWLAPT